MMYFIKNAKCDSCIITYPYYIIRISCFTNEADPFIDYDATLIRPLIQQDDISIFCSIHCRLYGGILSGWSYPPDSSIGVQGQACAGNYHAFSGSGAV